MDDARAMRRGERVGGLDGVAKGRLGSHRPALGDDPLEVDAVHEVHGDPGHVLVLARAADTHDPGMIDDGERARLAQEPRASGVRRDPRRHHLEHDPRAVRVTREKQDAHPALRESPLDDVASDSGAGRDEGGDGGHGGGVLRARSRGPAIRTLAGESVHRRA